MKYDITLRIDYQYDLASDRARGLLRLMPPDIPGQQAVTSRIVAIDPPPHERHDATDFFGNVMTAFAYHDPIDTFAVSLRARIERMSLPVDLDLSPPVAGLAREIAEFRGFSARSPQHFRGASQRVAASPEMTGYARSCLGPGMTVTEAVIAIGSSLFRDMRYDAEATSVDTAPAEAFAKRHGVCQDFAHVMIACLRGIGIPAGYVSGFLRTLPPPGQPRLQGADAMHAWVMAWCGIDAGWLEFDPTNNQLVGVDHILLAAGRDYGDVAPVKGAMRTSGGHQSSQSVDVVAAG